MIIISPAKNLNILPENYSVDLTRPILDKHTKKIILLLKKMNLKDLKSFLRVSDSLAKVNFQRINDFDTNDNIEKPAVFLFSGDTFNGLSIRSLDKNTLETNINYNSKTAVENICKHLGFSITVMRENTKHPLLLLTKDNNE